MDRDKVAATLGANVKAAREARGWSQDDLSRRAEKLSVIQISRIERGQRDVRLTTLLQLAAALEITPDELLAGLH